MKVIHAHIDVRMISLAIGVNSLSLPVMRKIVDKISDYFSYIYKFLCWFYWKTLEEIGIQRCFCCGLVFQGEFMVVPSPCERSGNWKHLLTSSPSCGERGGKGWLKLHGWHQVVITLFLAVFSFIQYHTSFYRAVFFNWKLWKADKYQYIFNYTNSWPKWITMLEYWLRGRGNRALLQSQSTTWRAYFRGVLWRCIWCICVWRLRET